MGARKLETGMHMSVINPHGASQTLEKRSYQASRGFISSRPRSQKSNEEADRKEIP